MFWYIMKYGAAHGGEKELLLTGKKNYTKMLALNNDIEQSDAARQLLQKIETALRRYQ